MNFDNKYADVIKRFNNIEKPDYPQSQINNYADFVELLVLFSNKDGVSFGDVQDLFFGEPDEDSDAVKKDCEESFLKGVFSLINDRVFLYKDLYPFEKINESLCLKSPVLDIHKYYIFLLVSSSLGIFHSFLPDLTKDFETLSFEVLKKYIPTAIVKPFGKNTVYKGTAQQKIKKLSKDIGIPVNEYAISQIEKRNNQERGLDVVAWLPFEDNCQNKVVFLAQCACGKNFESKQHDTRRFEDYLVFYKTKPQHTLFIPYSLINVAEGKFYGNHIEEGYLVFERKRMVSLLRGNVIYHKLCSRNLIEKCVCAC